MFTDTETRLRARAVVNKLNKILDDRKIIMRSRSGAKDYECDGFFLAADVLEKRGFNREAAILYYLAKNPFADIYCDEYTRAAMRTAVNAVLDELSKSSKKQGKQTESL